MTPQPAKGLPLKIALPALAVFAAIFLGIMAYFLHVGLGSTGTALGSGAEHADARIAATPAPTDEPGETIIPQTGGGAEAPAAGLPPGTSVGGGPPAPVAQALAQLRARLARNPRDLSALVTFANLEFDAGKYDRAAGYYERALVIDPANPDTRTDYATTLHLLGRDLQALRQIRIVLAKTPGFPQALYNEGVIARAIGRRTEAAGAFRAFLKAAPHDRNAEAARSALTELTST